jgi:exosortase
MNAAAENRNEALQVFAKGRSFLLAGGLILLFAPALVRLANVWNSQEDYSHGFFVIPISLFLAWRQRNRIQRTPVKPAWAGTPVFFMGLLVYVVSFSAKFHTLAYYSIPLVLFGLFLSLCGMGIARPLLVPILFLFFMFPIPSAYYVQITHPMKLLVTEASVEVIRLIGLPVFRDGNLLFLARTELEVTEACSGIRSLYAYVMLGCLFASLSRGWIKKAAMVALPVPIALAVNVVRVTGTAILSNAFGPEAAQGFFHEFTGFVFFLVGFVILCAFHSLIHRRRV